MIDTSQVANMHSTVDQIVNLTNAIILVVSSVAGFIAGHKHGNSKRARGFKEEEKKK